MELIVKTRIKANELVGVNLPPGRPSNLSKEGEGKLEGEKGIKLKYDDIEIGGLVKRNDTVKAPLFNVTDGSAQTQEDIGKIIEKVFGIKVDFVSFSSSSFRLITHSLYACKPEI